ncbi:hypothetical protein [Bacillus sp. AG4(2022)]|uniref:phage lytic cycle repressor MrpR family protein n=1 Tax=Bacillus sp. AG4(2022) TaxID=2962594 RepID=UPI002882131E|nr:hypothetical protein [Bacillus sp. AG4(2022)]MDT0160395.1 hypothetical protein [Bacillus sp. AG4(2022)]
MAEFYNNAIKQRYLEGIKNEHSRQTISYIFTASRGAEENVLGTDLYNFSKEDIEKVLSNMNCLTYNSARSNTNFIKNYISWAISNGYRENNLHPLDGIDKKWMNKFVDKTTKIHYSDEEFYDLLEELPNAQDQALLYLIFEGISGSSFSQLQALTYNDINWNKNEVYVKERDESIELTDAGMRYLENAYKAATYRYFDSETGDHKERDLLNSDYLFKNPKSPRTKTENLPVTTATLYNRLNNIRNEFLLQHLTPISIKQSGMIHTAAKILQEKIANGEDPKLSREDIKVIGDKYQASKVENREYSYYNRSLMKQFINAEKLKELYGIDFIEFGSDSD